MQSPQVSIIVPIYNAEKYLRQCLDSILQQTFTDFELILVDDGSTDSSADICMEYMQKDERIQYIHQDNNGVSSARNKGIDISKGKLIYFADADDMLFPDGITCLMFILQEHYSNTDISMGTYIEKREDGNIIFKETKSFYLTLNRIESINLMFDTSKYNYQGFLWNKMFKKSIIINNNVRFDERLHFNEDRIFCLQYICAMKGCMRFISQPIYQYIHNSQSVMRQSEKVFDKNIYDDFHSSVESLYVLRKNNMPHKTINLAYDRIIDSYDFIRHRMRKTHTPNKSRKTKELRYHVIKLLGIRFFIFNRIRRFFSKQLSHILKRNIYIKA